MSALNYLEKLDQTVRAARWLPWPEQRLILAETIVHAGLSPWCPRCSTAPSAALAMPGAELLLGVSEQIDPAIGPDSIESERAAACCATALMPSAMACSPRCKATRMAAAVYPRAGRFDETLKEMLHHWQHQERRRMGDFSSRSSDQNLAASGESAPIGCRH